MQHRLCNKVSMNRILFHSLYTIVQRLCFAIRLSRLSTAKTVNVIYKPDAIGDFVLATGAIREILKREDRPWVLITSPAVADFACEQFPGLEVVSMRGAYEEGLLRSWKRLASLRSFARGHRVDTLLCLRHTRNGFDQVILHWLAPRHSHACVDAPIFPPLPGKARYFRFDHEIPYPSHRERDLPLEITAHRSLLEHWHGGPVGDLTPVLNHHSTRPQPAPYILVFPATRSRLRNYPPNRLANALRSAIPPEDSTSIIIMGLPEESPIINALAGELSELKRVGVIFPSSLSDLMCWIRHSRAVVSMDSAPAHFAITFRRPGVFLLAAGQWGHFAPWQTCDNQLWLSTRPACQGCNWICPFPEPHCITSIQELEIASALRRILEAPSIPHE